MRRRLPKPSTVNSLTRHSSKNKYLYEWEAKQAAAKYTRKHGFLYRVYGDCDECEYWHIASVTHGGSRVLSLEEIQRGADDS